MAKVIGYTTILILFLVAAGWGSEAAKKYLKSEDKKVWGLKVKRDVFYYEKDGEQFADSVVYHVTYGDKILYHGDPTVSMTETESSGRFTRMVLDTSGLDSQTAGVEP